MALTFEELQALTADDKLKILYQNEFWQSFSDQQQGFLVDCAKGMNHLAAFKKNYPKQNERTITTGVRKLYTSRRIRQAMNSIGVLPEGKLVADKQEAIEMLTRHLRCDEPDIAIKAYDRLSKLLGWNKGDKEPDETPEVDPFDAVRAAEKERRDNAKENQTEN